MNEVSFWRDRRVFLTGHTGFKGGWLALLLHRLGAQVTGYALAPDTTPSLFAAAGVDQVLDSRLSDLRDDSALTRAMLDSHPEVVIHMAAQALVRRGYAAPTVTYATNVMGTVNLLEAVRHCPTVRAVLVVTSDKCYDNQEWARGYRESDALGGYDPYSSSKACVELAVQSWRKSFLAPAGIAVATARAGNVIGGGDWAEDRLLPDVVRAVVAGQPVAIRHPDAIRPWQHVLEPLAGYLTLAHQLCAKDGRYAAAWNFGPDDDSAWPVAKVVDHVFHLWGQGCGTPSVQGSAQSNAPHEAHWLKLDASKARRALGWQPRLSLETALAWSVDWYRAYYDNPTDIARIRAMTGQQIEHYLALKDGVHG
ncbi:MAG: CDP-glucose 4,6-dehydratase [Betaproteobacteria bacterium]|nr:CDP-glucose 4,6-dehydratase [Betaproteobacteria bacterium]